MVSNVTLTNAESVTINHDKGQDLKIQYIAPTASENVPIHIPNMKDLNTNISQSMPGTPKNRKLLNPNAAEILSANASNQFNAGQYDIYENDDMIDYFMDDIDESASICEGSRQSQ